MDGQDKVTELKFTYNLEIKSVEANALTVDDNTANQKLTFKINGEATDADLDYIKASGYNVEFQATTNVFNGTPVSSSSATGVLASDLSSLKDKSFAYKVVITDKDGNTVAESPLAEVKVVDKSSVYTSINSFDLVNDGVKLTSNTVTLNDSNASITNIKGDLADGTKDAPISTAVEYSSSNKNVALVDSTGKILPIAPGKTTITIKAGDATKTIDLTVAADARVAKTATVSNSNIKLISGGSPATVSVQVKDQYGDPVKDLDFNDTDKVSFETTKVDVNGTQTPIVDVVGASGANVTDNEGKAQLTVTPQAVGDGTVKVKAGNNVIATLNVSVSKDATVASHKLELVDPSQDTTLDLYADDPSKPDNTIKFVYNKYNASGYLLGAEDNISDDNSKQYSVSVDDNSVINASVDASGVITVTAQKPGTANLVIKEGSVVREKVAITVKDSSPTIASVALKSVDKVTAPTTIDASTVLSLTEDIPGKDKAVKDITLTTPSKNPVRIDDSGTIYLDANNNGSFDSSDEKPVGKLSITENITSDPTTGTVSIATVSGDKGSIVYSVKDNSGKVIATQVIDVDVQ